MYRERSDPNIAEMVKIVDEGCTEIAIVPITPQASPQSEIRGPNTLLEVHAAGEDAIFVPAPQTSHINLLVIEVASQTSNSKLGSSNFEFEWLS